MGDFELEQPDKIDYTLLGNRIEIIINAVVPDWIIYLVKGKENDCGCSRRKEWLNNKHLDYREWRISRAQTNYAKAKTKLDKLMKKYYETPG